MKYFRSTIKRQIIKKAKYWLVLASFSTILFPHAALAGYNGAILIDNGPVPIVALSLWPNYAQQFDTTEPIQTKRVTVTAYNSEVGQTDDSPFITAFGTYVRDGIVATNDLPRGTRVRFPETFGTKIFTVEDRMNRRYTGTGRADIWMASKKDAITFGARKLTMEVLPATVVLADNE
ncbi:MAG: hypothetical protein V1846_00395 [Candidatus Komeilibacteria bacterium]